MLRKIPLLAQFREEDMARLHPIFHSITLKPGETLFRQGDEGGALHVLLSGQIEVVQRLEGRDRLIATLGRRGDLVGEMALLGGENRPGTASAVRPSELLELRREEFEAVLRKNPTLALAVTRYLSQRLMQAVHRPPASPTPGRVFALVGSLPPKKRLSFVLNLALSALQQSRRRVLLVEVVEEESVSAISRLGPEGRSAPRDMDLQDFQTPEGLRSIALAHASGLDVISISEPLLGGRLFGGLYPLVTTARRDWDFVFISLPARSSRAARALWEEADRTLYVREESAERGGPLWREMESVVPAPRLDLVELQKISLPRRNRPGRYYIPWGTAHNGLFLSSENATAQQGLDRMARHLVGLRIGFAMGSGAALGYSIIGILRALERNGIFPDLLAGTSMGALIGSFYAAGKTVPELEEIALSITKSRLWSMADLALPWKGVVVGNGVLQFLKSVIGDVSFDQLRLPFACVATDINTGVERVLRHGAVAEAVRGSLSLPFFFEPFFWQGRYLVDGGLVNPVPTSIIQAMGADITLSVNITTAPSVKRLPGQRARRPSVFNPLHGPHIFKVMAKTLYTMQYGIAQAGANEADVVIAPDLSDFAWLEFHRAADIIKVGEEQAEKVMPKILSKLPFFNENARIPLRKPQ